MRRSASEMSEGDMAEPENLKLRQTPLFTYVVSANLTFVGISSRPNGYLELLRASQDQDLSRDLMILDEDMQSQQGIPARHYSLRQAFCEHDMQTLVNYN